jgi:hypothetical protein
MKTLIAAVIASVVSFGAFAQTTSPAMGASAPMSKPMASDSMSKPMASDSTKAHKATKKHAAKKASKKASAPAA